MVSDHLYHNGCYESISLRMPAGASKVRSTFVTDSKQCRNYIKSNLFAINEMHNITANKITFHLAGQTGFIFGGEGSSG